MELKHDSMPFTAWKWLWRMSVLALPWQTRLIFGGRELLPGYIPEETLFSFYVSWIPLLAAVLFGLYATKSKEWKLNNAVLIGFGLLGIASLFSVTAYTWQWWVQIAVLAIFTVSLLRMNVSKKELTAWFVLSLIPHVVLGVIQYDMQSVIGSSWLGMASQLPETPGVSVVFTEAGRILRAYGGFPHPNIFGGWLALGLYAAFLLVGASGKRWQTVLGWFALGAFPIALVLTFSRSAWLMLAAIILLHVIRMIRRRRISIRVTRGIALSLLSTLLVAGFVWPVLSARVPARGETAVEERLEFGELPLRREKGVFDRPLVGNGPGSSVFVLFEATGKPVPPHNIFSLALMETGVLGMIGLVLLGYAACQKGRGRCLEIGLILVPPLLLDHYLWSYWPGQALLMLTILLFED